VIALTCYGELLEASAGLSGSEPLSPEDQTPRRLQALLWALLLALAVLGAASRAPALAEGVVPRLAGTAVIACLLVLTVEGVVALSTQLRVRGPGAVRVREEPGSRPRSGRRAA
jgi:hypothetical protein